MENLNWIDIVVIAAYFLLVLGVAWWAAGWKKRDASDYFLAGRSAGWLLVGASLFVSNIGSEHLVGLAGTGAASGMAVGHFEWLASLILLLLGWLFVPFYLRSGVYTMPEFLAQRYNAACRWYFTSISIVGYVLTKISVALYAGGIIIQEVTGLSLWYSAGAVVVITGLYTAAGGLRAVLYTDTMQAGVLIVGTTLLVAVSLLTKPPRPGRVRGLTYETVEKEPPAADVEEMPATGTSAVRRRVNIGLSVLLVLILIGLYVVFA